MWFIGVEVEQETSAPPPKKGPGPAPDIAPLNQPFSLFIFHQKIRYAITMTIRLSLLRPQALRREVVKEGMPGREAPVEKVTQS